MKIIIIFSIIGFLLVLIWLPNNQIIAGGDVGIPLLSPQKQLKEVASSWWDSHATGITSPITYTAVPFYIILSFFQKIGLEAGILQKGLFFLILAGGSVSIYHLALTFKFNKWTSLIAALFYIFNLTSLSVWQRGVHNAMLMLLLLPLSFLILVSGVKNRRFSSIILINLISFLLSYVFGALGYFFSLWLLWTVYIFIVLLNRWSDKKNRKFILIFYFILVISWVATNSWWIIYLLQSSNYTLGQFTPEDLKAKSSDVLTALRPYHEPSIVLRGLSRFYLYIVKDWGEIYSHPFFIFLSWLPTLIVFSTTLIKDNYKSEVWRFLIVLTVLVLVLSKGVNAPLGELNRIPFDFIAFLAPLRNLYEKTGIILAIPFSLLFALGATQIYSNLKIKGFNLMKFSLIVLVFVSLTVLVWPLWLGKLFVSEGRKYIVSIPPYYEQANIWLQEKIVADDTRILHLPLSWGESVDYNWGYTGIEPSQYFFNGSSVGYQIGISSIDARIRDLLISIHNQDTANVQKALAPLNIGWVVIHNETVWRPRVLESPERIYGWLSTSPDFLEHKIDFGPLSVFKVKDEYRLGHFYPQGRLSVADGLNNLSFIKTDETKKLNDGIMTEIQKNHKDILNKFIEKNIVFPKAKMKYHQLGLSDAETALREIAVVNYLPDSQIYPLIIFKDSILNFLNQDDQIKKCFSLSGKRLKEAVLLEGKNKSNEVQKALKKYKDQLVQCTKISTETLNVYLNSPILREEILVQLLRQKTILENGFIDLSASDQTVNAKQTLNEYLSGLGISPKYEVVKYDSSKQIIIMNYDVTEDGEYNIKISKPDAKLLKFPPKIILIDNQRVEFSPVGLSEESIIYPPFKFSQGFHEVHLQAEIGENLIEGSLAIKKIKTDPGFKYQVASGSENAFLGEAVNTPISLSLYLDNLDITGSYELTFDMNFYQGERPVIAITNDTNPQDSSGNVQPSIKKDVNITSYPAELRGIRLVFNPSLNANSAKITFQFTGFTKALIKNIKVEKLFQYDLVLEKVNTGYTQKLGGVNIKWYKDSPTLYDLDLNNQVLPYILVFSETFHPAWQITDLVGNKIDLPHFSINGFANGWFIDKELAKKVRVEFMLQRLFIPAVFISVIAFILSSGLVAYLDKRK